MEVKGLQRNVRGAVSLWALLARSSVYKLLAVAAVMALGEAALFYACLRSGRGYVLGEVMKDSKVSMVFMAALGLWLLVLAGTERGMEEKSGNTMHRLTLSPGGIFWLKTAFNIGCLIILFVVQIWLAIWMVEAYGREKPEVYASPQRLFLAFYRIEFLHCLLPLAEVGKWARNAVLILALGMGAAVHVKGIPVPLISLYLLTAGWFVSPIGRGVADIVIAVSAAAVVVNGYMLSKKGEE